MQNGAFLKDWNSPYQITEHSTKMWPEVERECIVAATGQVCAWQTSGFRICDVCLLAHNVRSVTRNRDGEESWEICETVAHQILCVGAGVQDKIE
jgi:hypothetical protein